ncbi:MAG: AAA family ATPase [Pseudonocardiales bacterium]
MTHCAWCRYEVAGYSRHTPGHRQAGTETTRELDAIITAVRKAGAKLLLTGDDKQHGAMGVDGVFRTVVDRMDAPVLSTVPLP